MQCLLQEPAFNSLLDLAKSVLRDRTLPTWNQQHLEAAVYSNYAVTTRSSIDRQRIQARHTSEEYEQTVHFMDRLALAHGDTVRIYMQNFPDNATRERPLHALWNAATSRNYVAACRQLYNSHFAIEPLHRRTRQYAGADGIESRLSITTKPVYSHQLAAALADICGSGSDGFVKAKLVSANSLESRTETGILYLSEANPQTAATLAACIDEKLKANIRKVIEESGDLPAEQAGVQWLRDAVADLTRDDLYRDSPPGTVLARAGIAYSEKPRDSEHRRSSGQERAKVVADAIADHRILGKDLALALADRLKQAGFSTVNPAFAHRPDEDIDAVRNRVHLLQSLAPDNFSENPIPPTLPGLGIYRNQRERFAQNIARNVIANEPIPPTQPRFLGEHENFQE